MDLSVVTLRWSDEPLDGLKSSRVAKTRLQVSRESAAAFRAPVGILAQWYHLAAKPYIYSGWVAGSAQKNHTRPWD